MSKKNKAAKDIPAVEEMVDLNAELEKARPTEPGVTGYLRARMKGKIK